jgi:outer membrane protein
VKKFFLLFFALALSVPTVSHALPGVDIDVSVGISKPTPTGSIALGGTTYDVANTLNLGAGNDVIAKLDISHAIPILPNIYYHHLPVEVTGSNGGHNAEIKIQQEDIGLYYHLPFLGTVTNDILDAKWGLNARLMSFSASSDLAGTATSFNAPLPMVYLGLDFKPIHLLAIAAEIKTLPLGDSNLTEWSAELRVKPLPLLYIGAGFSHYVIKIDPSLTSGAPATNMTFAGPYFVLGLEL